MEIFLECSSCRRNLESKPDLWDNLEKRICKCCACIGHGNEIIACRRKNCPLHKYIADNDYIILSEAERDVLNGRVVEAYVSEEPHDVEREEYDLNSNVCYKCGMEMNEYVFINSKMTYIPGEDIGQTKSKLKVKICVECYNKFLEGFMRKRDLEEMLIR